MKRYWSIRAVWGADDGEIQSKREWVKEAEEIIAGAERARRLSHKREGHHIHHVEAWFEIPGETGRSQLVGSVQNREGNMVYLTYADHVYVHLCEYFAYGLAWKSGLRTMFRWMYNYYGIDPAQTTPQLLSDFEIWNTDKKQWPATRVIL